MIQLVDLQHHAKLTLDDYAKDPRFINAVVDLRTEAQRLKKHLQDRTIWMVNSTAQGGGVAEMLPRLLGLMEDLQIPARWAVISTDQEPFFVLTKRLHNLIHGDAGAGLDLSAEDARLFEAVNRENAASLKQQIGPDDILVVHDPQPLPLGHMLAQERIKTVWRCHIGLDARTDATRAAWRFLRPYLEHYEHAAFSVPEYIPSFLTGRSRLLYPAIDPISHKNRELSVGKLMGILCNSGAQQAYEPVPTPPFDDQVKRVTPSGQVEVPGEIGLLFRPIVLQVSRWDRLKGWLPLIDGFVRLKTDAALADLGRLDPRNRRRLELSRLVLAGPDPSSIADDPEGLEVLEQIKQRYFELDPQLQQDVVVLLLPMTSTKENALIVNALQRCAAVVVQNSLQEGFGLTVTEAMWKRRGLLGSSACGIRQQVRDGIDGLLVEDAENPAEIAVKLRELLVDPRGRYLMGKSGERRVYDEFLVFRQLARYFQLFEDVLTGR